MSEITTAVELDALPSMSAVLDKHGTVWQKSGGTYPARDNMAIWRAAEVARAALGTQLVINAGPLTLLHRPDRPAHPTAQPSAEAVALVSAWLDDDSDLRIPDTELGRGLYDALRTLIGGRTEAEAVKGVQQWMALDLHMALGHGVEPPADAGRDWADWWARMLAEVRERRTEAEVKAEALEEYAESRYAAYLEDRDTPWPDQPSRLAQWYAKSLEEMRARAAAIRAGEQ